MYGDDNSNAVRVRGRSLTRDTCRSESPLTRQRKKQLEEQKLSGSYFFSDNGDLPNEVSSSVLNEKIQSNNDVKTKPKLPYNSTVVYGYNNTYRDNPKHLYGLDVNQKDSNHAMNCRKNSLTKNIKQEPDIQQEVVSSCQSIQASIRVILTEYKNRLRIPPLSIIALILVGLILMYCLTCSTNTQSEHDENKLHKLLSDKIESVVSHLSKQVEQINLLDSELKIQKQAINSIIEISKKLNDSLIKLEKRVDDRTEINNNNAYIKDELKKLSITDREINSLLKERKTVDDDIKSKVSHVADEVQTLKNQTSATVKKEIKKELQREREKYNGENSLCIGAECRFRSSNAIADIQAALDVYRADTVGFPDFALTNGGGSVHEKHHSEPCDFGNPTIKLFGVPLYVDSSPRLAITASNNPGDCWHMKGSDGYIVIKMATKIQPTMVSLEHLDKNLDRYSRYMYLMAPKGFEVYAWQDAKGKNKLLLGTFTYRREGSTIQTFSLRKRSTQPVLYVELRILSNWGNDDCTCIYRFRVHGISYDWNEE